MFSKDNDLSLNMWFRRRDMGYAKRKKIWAHEEPSTKEKNVEHMKAHVLKKGVASGFKNKTRYTPYVSPGSQISYIATNKGNIERQCSIYNILSIKNITLDSKQPKGNSDLQVKTPIL